MKKILLLAALAAPACALGMDVRPIVRAGYDFGGEAVAEVVYTNGDTDTIRANEGFYFGVGASFLTEGRSMEVELSANAKFGGVSGSNGDVDWRRFPLEALWFYRLDKVRLGGGVTYHLNPKLDGSGVVGTIDTKFDNALGVVLQADWRFNEHATVGLRYTSIEYEAKDVPLKAKGNGVGVTGSYRF